MIAPPPKFSGNSEEILDHLLKKPELSGMELALYDEQGRLLAMRGGAQDSGGPTASLLCEESCPLKQTDRIIPDRNHLSPCLESCPGGLWHYLQPCQNQWGGLHTLVVGGVRRPEVNLPFLETLVRERELSASTLLELLDSIPTVTRQDMLETGRALRRYLTDSTSLQPAFNRPEQLSYGSLAAASAAVPAEYLLNKLEVLGSHHELRDLCRQILETAAQLAKAGKGSLMLRDGNGGKLKLLASIGMNSSLVNEVGDRQDQSISKLVLHSGQPLLVSDLAKDPRIKTAPRPRFRTRSLLSLPLGSHQGMLGVLNLADKWDDNSFSQSDLSLLSTWTGYCAPLVERLANRQDIDQLKKEAGIDPLTGVYNQRLLEKRFTEEASRAKRSDQDLILMLIAPDRDGNNAPDPTAIREEENVLVEEMGNLLRKMDIIGRLDSGAFALLLPNTPRDGAMIVGERLCLAVAKRRPEAKLTISCGMALFPRHGAHFSALLQSAETALKKACSEGGNAPLFVDQIEKNDKIIYI